MDDIARIVGTIETYEARLQAEGVPKVRLLESSMFADAKRQELLAHAHYLCDGTKQLLRDPHRQRKAGSHLMAIQMCLSLAGWLTLADIMHHSEP